jgi:hypothetical protein
VPNGVAGQPADDVQRGGGIHEGTSQGDRSLAGQGKGERGFAPLATRFTKPFLSFS